MGAFLHLPRSPRAGRRRSPSRWTTWTKTNARNPDFQREEENDIWTPFFTNPNKNIKPSAVEEPSKQETQPGAASLHIPALQGDKSVADDVDGGGKSHIHSHTSQLFYKQNRGKVCLLVIRSVSFLI